MEAIVQCSPYGRLPKTSHAIQAAVNIFNQWKKRTDWHAKWMCFNPVRFCSSGPS